MRDGSLNDIVRTWVGRIIDEHRGRNPGDNEAAVYFALLRHAVLGLVDAHTLFKPGTDYREEIGSLLRALRSELSAELPTGKDIGAPELVRPDVEPLGAIQVPPGDHADYWSGDRWRKDFYTSFTRWFWDMKDYASAANRRKSDFLFEVAEIWVATAASALVYYAKDDRHRWFETAQMLRHYADLVEVDGLRSLPWGRWGRHSRKNWKPSR